MSYHLFSPAREGTPLPRARHGRRAQGLWGNLLEGGRHGGIPERPPAPAGGTGPRNLPAQEGLLEHPGRVRARLEQHPGAGRGGGQAGEVGWALRGCVCCRPGSQPRRAGCCCLEALLKTEGRLAAAGGSVCHFKAAGGQEAPGGSRGDWGQAVPETLHVSWFKY